MAHIVLDRIRDITNTTGTGTVTLLNGVLTGFRRFSDVMSTNDTCPYLICGRGDLSSSGDWEIGIGTYNSTGPTLARTTILASSNAGAVVTLGTAPHDVFLVDAAIINDTIFVAGNTGATPTPDCTKGPTQFWTQSANATWGAPTTPWRIGQQLILQVQQDGTGGYTTAWNATYRNAPAWAAGTASQRATAMFIYDGANWQYIGGSTAFA